MAGSTIALPARRRRAASIRLPAAAAARANMRPPVTEPPQDPTRAQPGPTIQQLVELAAQGDQAAVAELLTSHLDALQEFVRRRMGTPLLRRESTSDVVQSICREALEKADRFRFPEANAFRRWLYAMAERKLGHRYEFYAAERRRSDREQQQGSRAHELPGAGASPSRAAMAREEMARVESAFARLPAHYQQLIVQARVQGLSREQIAAQTGQAPAAVGNMLFRALAALAEELERG